VSAVRVAGLVGKVLGTICGVIAFPIVFPLSIIYGFVTTLAKGGKA
jgi:hypothetical protein